MVKMALTIKPHLVTLVPERRQELTTEGGLEVSGQRERIKMLVDLLHDGGIPVSCSSSRTSIKSKPPIKFQPTTLSFIPDATRMLAS